MRLLKSIGLTEAALGEEETVELLVMGATRFLQAGGILTLDDYADLLPQERAALITANDIVQSERAALYGLATQGPLSAAMVSARADGGEAVLRIKTEQAARTASMRLLKERIPKETA